jgi:hypothetical protein
MLKKFNYISPIGPRVVSLGFGVHTRQDILLKLANHVALQKYALAFNLTNYPYPLDTARNILKVIGFQSQASIVLDLMHYNFYRFLEHSPITPIIQIKPYVQHILQNEENFSKDIVYDINHRWNFFLSMKMNSAGLLFHASNRVTVDPINYQLIEEQGQSIQNYRFFIQPSFFPQALDEVLEQERLFLRGNQNDKNNSEFNNNNLGWVRAQTDRHRILSISVPLLSLSKIKREVDSIRKDSNSKLEEYEKVLSVGITENRRFWLHEILEIKEKLDGGNPSLFLYDSELADILKKENVNNLFIRI